MAIVGTAKRIAKKSATLDFLLWSAGPSPLSIKVAPYPALLLLLILSLVFTSAGAKMWTVSVAKLTLALTPLIEFKVFSTEFTQEEQVIPDTENVRGVSEVLLKSISLPGVTGSALGGRESSILISSTAI
jgi:hypothetical protein